jgi:hypothetical protein
MTLGAGCSTCATHTTAEDVVSRVRDVRRSDNTTFILNDTVVNSTVEIDQLSAVSEGGRHIDVVFKTSHWRNTSPIIGKCAPMQPIVTFVEWVRDVLITAIDERGSDSDVELIAHSGMFPDHVILIKTMLVWGAVPPTNLLMCYKQNKVVYEPLGVVTALVSWYYPFHNFIGPVIGAIFARNGFVVKVSEQTCWSAAYYTKWILSDSLPTLKIVIIPGEKATLSALATRYVPWFRLPLEFFFQTTVFVPTMSYLTYCPYILCIAGLLLISS